MADDNVIRLDFESNFSKAQSQADKFISDLEKRFKALGKELNVALDSKIVDPSTSKEVEKLRKELDRLENELKDVRKAGDNAGQGISKIGVAFSALAGVIAGLGLAKIASGFANLAKDAFKATASLEQTRLALSSLVAREFVQTGQFDNLNEALDASSEKANELLGFIKELAKESPFSREQIQNAFQTALAYGFTIEEAKRLTTATVDLAAASGRGAEATGRIALALGQIQAKGKVSAEELNQLRESGLNVNPILADLGFTLDDVTKGLVQADVFIEAVVSALERDFGGAAARATESLSGLVSTLGDLRTDALIAFFEPAFQALQPQIAEFSEGFSETVPSIREAGEAFGELISVLLTDAPKAVEVVNGISTAFEGLAKIIETVQKIRETELFGISLGDVSGNTVDSLVNPVGQLIDSIQQINESTGASNAIGDFFTGITDRAKEFPIVQEAFTNLKTSVDALSFGAGTLNEAQKLLGEGFRGTTEELLKLAASQTLASREEERLAEIAELAASRQGDLHDRIEQTAIARERSAQSANTLAEATEDEAEATEAAAEANRKLIVSLVESTNSADKNAIAIFKQAEAAGATGEQLEQLAVSLGLLSGQQVAAKRALERLTTEFVNGDISAEQFAKTAAELNAIIAGTGSNASKAAVGVNNLTNAFKNALTPQKRRGGGGGRASNTQADELKAEAEAIEKQADSVQNAVKRFSDIVTLDSEALQELIENSRDFGDELVQLTEEAGASIDTIIKLGVATGEFTEEQAKAALEVAKRERGLKAIAEAAAKETITTEQATEAVAELNRQIAEGEQLDLSKFGINVEDIDTKAVPALLRDSAQAAREAADALTKIAGALGGVSDESDDLATTIKKQVAQQRESEATSIQGKIAAIRFAEALGLYDEATARSLEQTALLDEQVRLLQVAAGTGALTDGQLAEALVLITDNGYSAQEAFIAVGGSIDDLPEDVQIELETNSDEVLSEIDEVEDRLNRLERERVITLRINREEQTVQTGGTGAGSIPLPDDADFSGQHGGFTGKGNPKNVAGIVHKEELVIPQNVLRGGIPAIASFAASNVPNLRDTISLSNPSPVQNAVIPSLTTINNTTNGGNTIDNSSRNIGGDTIILNGEQAGRVARSIFSNRSYLRQNQIMKRNNSFNALFPTQR